MTQTKDHSLLRAFNQEQAQAGEEVVISAMPWDVTYKGCTSDNTGVFYETTYDGNTLGGCISKQNVRMKPLAWVEGKPLYKGDVLYYNLTTTKALVVSEALTFGHGSVGVRTSIGGTLHFTQELTWEEPKKHVHQDLIDAFEKGAKIQFSEPTNNDWCDVLEPTWSTSWKYRIKPHKHQDLFDAYKVGAVIQSFNFVKDAWLDDLSPTWSEDYYYRVKHLEKTKKSGWINLWGNSDGSRNTGGTIYSTKEQATKGLSVKDLVDTIEIHWEE
jgi:hypothetical protein